LNLRKGRKRVVNRRPFLIVASFFQVKHSGFPGAQDTCQTGREDKDWIRSISSSPEFGKSFIPFSLAFLPFSRYCFRCGSQLNILGHLSVLRMKKTCLIGGMLSVAWMIICLVIVEWDLTDRRQSKFPQPQPPICCSKKASPKPSATCPASPEVVCL